MRRSVLNALLFLSMLAAAPAPALAAGAERDRAPAVTGAVQATRNPATVRARELHEDLGTQDKIFVSVACASHWMLWERQHRALHRLSSEWPATVRSVATTAAFSRWIPRASGTERSDEEGILRA
ncbi:MAG: hypothetical protein M3N32_08990 [Actinomycetota bacterium]|nr:hypothetical protein [Actinomycetota bacterium]